jgi:hypothetical protein
MNIDIIYKIIESDGWCEPEYCKECPLYFRCNSNRIKNTDLVQIAKDYLIQQTLNIL